VVEPRSTSVFIKFLRLGYLNKFKIIANMMWMIYAVGVAFCTALMDLFIKYSTGKIHDGLGSIILNFSSIVPVLIYTLAGKISGDKIVFSKLGVFYSVLGGLSIGFATLFVFKVLALDINLSIVVPVFRVGIMIFSTIFGVLLFKENLNLKFIAGFLMVLVGLFLISTARR
jgi:uncharacterized membrane protein